MAEEAAAAGGQNGQGGQGGGAASGQGQGQGQGQGGNTGTSQQPTAKWFEPLDQDTLTHIRAAGYDRLEDPAEAARETAKAHRNLTQRLGQQRLTVPPREDPEKLAQWEGWKELGVPDKPDAYDIKVPELPKDLPWDKELEGGLRDVAVKAKLAPFQVQQLVDWFATSQKERFERAMGEASQADGALATTLKKEWGASYDANVDLAKRAATHFLSDDPGALDRLADIIGSPALTKMFQRIGVAMGEDSLESGDGRGTFGMSPAEAKAEYGRVLAQMNGMQQSHPDFKRLQTRLEELAKIQSAG